MLLLPPHLTIPQSRGFTWGIVGRKKGGGGECYEHVQWVEVRNVPKCPAICRTAATIENNPVPNVNSAKEERSPAPNQRSLPTVPTSSGRGKGNQKPLHSQV